MGERVDEAGKRIVLEHRFDETWDQREALPPLWRGLMEFIAGNFRKVIEVLEGSENERGWCGYEKDLAYRLERSSFLILNVSESTTFILEEDLSTENEKEVEEEEGGNRIIISQKDTDILPLQVAQHSSAVNNKPLFDLCYSKACYLLTRSRVVGPDPLAPEDFDEYFEEHPEEHYAVFIFDVLIDWLIYFC